MSRRLVKRDSSMDKRYIICKYYRLFIIWRVFFKELDDGLSNYLRKSKFILNLLQI